MKKLEKNMQCCVPGCRAIGDISMGMCNKHRLRLLRHGDPNTVLPRGLAQKNGGKTPGSLKARLPEVG